MMSTHFVHFVPQIAKNFNFAEQKIAILRKISDISHFDFKNMLFLSIKKGGYHTHLARIEHAARKEDY